MKAEKQKLIILGILYLILLLIDFNTTYKSCARKVSILLPIHRLIWIFSYFGWIFNSKVILWCFIIVNIMLFFHWMTNRWKCIVTEIENKKCNFEPDTRSDYIYVLMKDDKKATIVAGTIRIILIAITLKKLDIF